MASAPGADPATLTVRRTLGETLELTDKLRARFEKQRIVLVGHSWGSYLAMLAIRERPDAYSGYVGIGQMAADQERVAAHRIEAIRPLAEAAGDEDLLARLDSGGVTEDDLLRHGVELRGATTFWPILQTGLMAPEYDLFDAMIYYGDESEWEFSTPEFDEERDAEYLVELERRRGIRFPQD